MVHVHRKVSLAIGSMQVQFSGLTNDLLLRLVMKLLLLIYCSHPSADSSGAAVTGEGYAINTG